MGLHLCHSKRACGHEKHAWLPAPASLFKRGKSKRFKHCEACLVEQNDQQREYMKTYTLKNAPKNARDWPALCFCSAEDLAKDAAQAINEAKAILDGARLAYPIVMFSVNIFGASTGMPQYSIEEEGTKNLTERSGRKTRIVKTTKQTNG